MRRLLIPSVGAAVGAAVRLPQPGARAPAGRAVRRHAGRGRLGAGRLQRQRLRRLAGPARLRRPPRGLPAARCWPARADPGARRPVGGSDVAAGRGRRPGRARRPGRSGQLAAVRAPQALGRHAIGRGEHARHRLRSPGSPARRWPRCIIGAFGNRAILLAIAAVAVLNIATTAAMLAERRTAQRRAGRASGGADDDAPVSRPGSALIVAAFIALQATNSAVVSVMSLFVTQTLGLRCDLGRHRARRRRRAGDPRAAGHRTAEPPALQPRAHRLRLPGRDRLLRRHGLRLRARCCCRPAGAQRLVLRGRRRRRADALPADHPAPGARLGPVHQHPPARAPSCPARSSPSARSPRSATRASSPPAPR